MRTSATVIALSLSIAFVSAQDKDFIKGTGEVVKKPLTVDAFHGIVLEGAADVVITQAATQSVEIEAQANIAELVTTTVKGGIWTIGTGNKSYSTSKPFIVHISVPTIDQVRIEGSGDVTGHGSFTADKVELAIEGSGNIDLKFSAKAIEAAIAGSGNIDIAGECTTFKASVAGSGDVDASELSASQATADVAGSGNIDLRASESLSAEVAGSGNVSYKGKPTKVHKDVSGSGSVRAID